MKVYFCDVCGADMRAYNGYEMGIIEMFKREPIDYVGEMSENCMFDVCPNCFEKVMNYIKGGAK